ncbi:MAG TPA: sigma 54-interacting transcriptional regulator, partial [Syntrophales bacterium]|nr:sigma 54-interacting transcriptional regulator [Syntrophales bacterium]
PQFQSKLLRVIQEKEIRRVGETASRPVDVRIVAATNRDLKKMIGEGAFREDLYYRLSVIDIVIPPLRERKEDILPLAEYFLQDINGRLGTEVEGISARTMAVLMAYPWPGNVRELRNSLERAALLSGHKMLEPEDFPLALEHYLGLAEEKHRGDEIIPLKEMERRHLLKAMQRYNYNQKVVAKKLGIGYTTLWRKLKESEKDFGSTP